MLKWSDGDATSTFVTKRDAKSMTSTPARTQMQTITPHKLNQIEVKVTTLCRRTAAASKVLPSSGYIGSRFRADQPSVTSNRSLKRGPRSTWKESPAGSKGRTKKTPTAGPPNAIATASPREGREPSKYVVPPSP